MQKTLQNERVYMRIQNLLDDRQVCVEMQNKALYTQDKCVLVTGAGGTIGSELCQQIAQNHPSHLILFDQYENGVFYVEQQLRERYPDIKLSVRIGNVRDKATVWRVFDVYRPQMVFHAAAQKHVPLSEESPLEAIKTNVFGTLYLARAAQEFQAETFVLISTDKAVRPVSVMGRTKRVAEMIIQTIGKHSKDTKFVAVRFGNVFRSNGSVIPTFQSQIERGGPVTVTHPEITRYFMSVQEAVSLVLEAGRYAMDGEIFVLDMGEPVRVYDLACAMIRRVGKRPHTDIDIVFTGLRKGEKLFEERLLEEEGLQCTDNGKINIAKPIPLQEERFWRLLERLEEQAFAESDEAIATLQEILQ